MKQPEIPLQDPAGPLKPRNGVLKGDFPDLYFLLISRYIVFISRLFSRYFVFIPSYLAVISSLFPAI